MIDFLVHEMMMPILNFFYSLTSSYGWAIVLLTLAVKALLMPLTVKQFKSILSMQRLQPKLKELQQKYKGNPEELNKRMIEFYREHQVNPFGGCLPILVQMPFLIALYALLISEEFSKMVKDAGPFYFIENLAQSGLSSAAGLHWDIILLIILFGITTFISQKMMTFGDDPMQKQMLYMMPIMITATFIFVPVPSGVLLYMVFSNLVTMAQNVWMLRERNRLVTTGDIPAKGVDLTKGSTGSVIKPALGVGPANATMPKPKKSKKKRKG